MKKIAIFSTVAALASLAMSASALTNGLESVTVHATVVVQDGDVTKNVSITDKDLLYLIGQEFGTIPNGAKLISYGMEDELFGVLNSDNSPYILNASRNGDDYYLYPYADQSDDDYVTDEAGGDTDHYTDGYSGLTYRDATETYSFNFEGLGKITVDWANFNESYNLSGVGSCYLPSGDLKGYGTFGIVHGSISGSGHDVEDPFTY